MKHLVLCALAIAAAGLACGTVSDPPPALSGPGPTTTHLPNVDWLTYRDPTGFSIQHPLTWKQAESEGYPIVFVLPAAPGTTLIETRMEIAVRNVSGECRQSTYGAETPGESHASINGVDFLVQAGSGIAAGNIYDWTSYSTAMAQQCITVTFVLHSSSSGVYATEPAPFDPETESAIFEQLISTFRWGA